MSQEQIKAWWFDRVSDLVAQNFQLAAALQERDGRRTRRQNGATRQADEATHDQAPHRGEPEVRAHGDPV
jgi:hypothetical protein